MFCYTMRLNKRSDFAKEYDRFRDKLADSGVPAQERALIANQVEGIIAQYRRHIDLGNVRKYTANQNISGDGYVVRVCIGESFSEKLINFFRG